MELVLRNTDIFDNDYINKLEKLIEENISQLNNDVIYDVIVEFSAPTSYKPIFVYYNLTLNSSKKDIETFEHIISDKLSKVLYETAKILNTYNKKLFIFGISGTISLNNTVKINFKEVEENEVVYKGKGKNRRLGRAYFTNPTADFIAEKLGNYLNEEVSKLYDAFCKCFSDRKDISRILELPITASESDLYRAFFEKYKEVVFQFSNEERKKELFKILDDRVTELSKDLLRIS